MIGPFNLLDELPNVVVGETRAQTQGPRLDFEGWSRSALRSNVQSKTQELIDDLLERPAGAERFCAQLGRNVVVQG